MSTACKKMKLSVTALERDHLSSLADDCLYDIFSRLGQNDLDEISELSTRMHGATIRGRKYACKEDAMTVVITQDNRRQFSFTFTIGKLGERRLERTVKASMKQISERLTDLKGAVNFGGVDPSSELDKLNILMNRFNYDSQFKFEKAFITPIYLEFFERIISNQYVENVTFQEDCVISLDNASRKRFLSIVRSANPDTVVFNPKSKTGISDVDFMRDLAYSGTYPSLTDKSLHKPLISLNEEEAKSILVKYIVIDVPNMVINTNWIIDIVTTRLRLGENGKWSFMIDRDITDEDIDAVERTEFETSHRDIKMMDSNDYVSLETEEINHKNTTFYQLTAKFYFRFAHSRKH